MILPPSTLEFFPKIFSHILFNTSRREPPPTWGNWSGVVLIGTVPYCEECDQRLEGHNQELCEHIIEIRNSAGYGRVHPADLGQGANTIALANGNAIVRDTHGGGVMLNDCAPLQ